MRRKEEALGVHCKAGMGTKTMGQETRNRQESTCGVKFPLPTWSHPKPLLSLHIKTNYFPLCYCYLLCSEKNRLFSWFKDPFQPGNYQCHTLWAVIKERDQEGDWESWWPRRIIERPNQDPTETARGKPKMGFSSASFLACGPRSADFPHETEDEWCYQLSVTPSNQDNFRFCFGLFFRLCFCCCYLFVEGKLGMPNGGISQKNLQSSTVVYHSSPTIQKPESKPPVIPAVGRQRQVNFCESEKVQTRPDRASLVRPIPYPPHLKINNKNVLKSLKI